MPTYLLLLTVTAALLSGPAALAADGEGLSAAPRWQGRILLGTASSNNSLSNAVSAEKFSGGGANANAYSGAAGGFAVRSFSVMGDYYFGNRSTSSSTLTSLGDLLGGSFRATSGLMVGPRGASLPSVNSAGLAAASSSAMRSLSVDLRSGYTLPAELASDTNTVPYLGLGFTGTAAKGVWGFSADVGVMALNPSSAVKLGRVFGGGQSLDDTLREMRVSPVLQLGVSYSF